MELWKRQSGLAAFDGAPARCRGFERAPAGSLLIEQPDNFEDMLRVMFGKYGNEVVNDIMAALRAAAGE